LKSSKTAPLPQGTLVSLILKFNIKFDIENF